MKLNTKLTSITAGGELLAVPASGNQMIRMNETTSRILDCLREDTDTDRIVEALKAEYEGSDAEIRAGVIKTIEALRSAGLISD